MLSTFNCGVGLVMVVSQKEKDEVIRAVKEYYDCYEIGRIVSGRKKVDWEGNLGS